MEFPLPAAILEFMILGQLENEDSYGYQLCQHIKAVQNIKEPVLYPILKRLEKEEWIESYQKVINSRLRKYYRLSEKGRNRLSLLRSDWMDYTRAISRLTGCMDPETHRKEEHDHEA